MPQECCTEDFQYMLLWRSFNYQVLKELDKGYSGTIIVPMTLVNPSYYGEVIQRLIDVGVSVLHVILYASRETTLKRLKKRSLDRPGREAFAVEAIDRCLDFFITTLWESELKPTGFIFILFPVKTTHKRGLSTHSSNTHEYKF